MKLGILPAVISPFVPGQDRPVGRARAVSDRRALLRRARPGDRPRARGRAGAELDAAVDGYVREILAAGPEAIAAAKALIRDVWGRPLDEARPITAQAIAERRVSAEGQEGLRAFLEKRKPTWNSEV